MNKRQGLGSQARTAITPTSKMVIASPNGSRLRRVYVIELSDAIGKRTIATLPNVYVGETGLSPEERFLKHKAGGRTASKHVTRYGVRLRPDLYEHLPEVETESESVVLEKALRSELISKGYRVRGGTRGMSESFARDAHISADDESNG